MYRLLSIIILLTLFLTSCLKHIPYEPELVDSFHQRSENLKLDYYTSKGKQVAFYIPPLVSPEKPPEKLAILYPGINSVALGWLRFIDLNEYPDTGYLLIDYPGRGFSEGMMQPEKNFINSEGAIKSLAKHFGLESLDSELTLMGHSFGTGAALQFATRYHVKRTVLIAPFNTLRKGVAVKSFLLPILMPSQIDNRNLIRRLLAGIHPPEITILHGTRDTSLPVTMGRDLASIDERVVFHEFPDDDHVNIFTRRRPLIFQALNRSED